MTQRNVSWTISANINNWVKNLNQAERRMERFGRNMQKSGRALTQWVTTPTLAAGAASVAMAAQFQSSMTKIEGLVGLARSEVQGMRSDVLRLAGETAQAPNDLAEAMFFVTSAGLRGAEATQVLEASAKAAAAGLGETKTVADLVTSAMNAYGSENLSATKATDILVASVKEGKAEASDLAASMGQVLPIASEMGVTFDQVGGAIAAMTRTGTDAATASTQLRSILTALVKPSKQAESALAQMGTSSANLRTQLREEGLVSVLGFLREQMEGNEQAMAQVLPNVRALSGALDIMGSNAESNRQIFDRMQDTTGSLDKAFAVTADTTMFKYNQQLSQLKANLADVGTTMLPIANRILNFVGKLNSRFSSLSESQKQQTVLWSGLAAAIGPVMVGMGTMIRLTAKALGPFKGMLKMVNGLTRAFFALLTPIGLKIALVAGLALVAKSLWDTFEPLQNFFKTLWDNIARTFQSAINFIIRGWNRVSDFISKVVPGISAAAVNTIDWMNNQTQNKLGEFVGNVEDNFMGALGFVRDFATGAKSYIGDFTSSLFESGGGSGIREATDDFNNFNRTVTAVSANAPSRLSELAKNMVQPVEGIKRGVGQAKTAAIEMGQALEHMVSQAIISFSETLGNAFTGDAGARGFFKNILLIVADFGKQLGKLLIATGVAAQAFQIVLHNPLAAIAAGSALLAASTAVSNLLREGPGGSTKKVNDALITSGGNVIEFNRADDILAFKNMGAVLAGGSGGGGNIQVSGTLRAKGGELLAVIESAKRSKR
ncbi:MAG: phage tail tape measure protein [Spirochaeta sp.]|nr:phage tail tape measure protein [Spirochaeta sp.]